MIPDLEQEYYKTSTQVKMDKKTRLLEAVETAEAVIKLAEKGNSEIDRAPLKMFVILSGTDRAGISAVIDMGKSNLDCVDFSELLQYSKKTERELIESIFYNYYSLSQNKMRDKLIKSILEQTELAVLLKRGIEILSMEE